MDATTATTLDNEPMDIVWKDSPIDPSENLTRLSQFARAYASTTIDKATDVKIFLKEKENKILLLEQHLQQEKSNEQAKSQLAKLQQQFKHMKIKHQANLAEKEAYIQGIIDMHKDDPKIDQFITRVLGLNSKLMHQKELLC